MPDEEKVEMTDENQATETEAEQTSEQEATETEAGGDDVEAMKAALKKANREAAKYRKQAEELTAKEQERKKAEMTEAERLKAELEETRVKARALELAQMRRDAAEKVGLPAALASRIIGETSEDMEADAAKLLEDLPVKPKQAPIGTTAPGKSDGKVTDSERAKLLWG